MNSALQFQPVTLRAKKRCMSSYSDDDIQSTQCSESYAQEYRISCKGTIINSIMTPTFMEKTNTQQQQTKSQLTKITSVKTSLKNFEKFEKIESDFAQNNNESTCCSSEWDSDEEEDYIEEPQYVLERINKFNQRKFTYESDFQDNYDDFDFDMEE